MQQIKICFVCFLFRVNKQNNIMTEFKAAQKILNVK